MTVTTDTVFVEKMKGGETSDDVVVNSSQDSDSSEMPKLSPQDINFKLRSAMPDLMHSST